MTPRTAGAIERPGAAAAPDPREDGACGPLYRQVLGSAFDALPARVRQLRDASGTRRWAGTAEVRRGSGLPARWIAAVFGFPEASASVPLTVTFAPDGGGGERWTRDFGGTVLSSHLSVGTGRDEHRLVERFGIARFSLALVLDGTRLFLVPRRWSLLGLPMPRWLLPIGTAFETETDGRFSFDITIAAPVVGMIVAYRGTLEPDPRA